MQYRRHCPVILRDAKVLFVLEVDISSFDFWVCSRKRKVLSFWLGERNQSMKRNPGWRMEYGGIDASSGSMCWSRRVFA